MKKFYTCLLAVILITLTSILAGCIVIQPGPSGAPKSVLPQQSGQPSESPSEAPQDTLILPDNDVQASFLIDLDGNGVKETVSVGLGNKEEIGNEIVLSVSDNGGFNQITVFSGYFESAALTETPGGAPCLLVCCSHEDEYTLTFACSFNGLNPVLHGSVEGYPTDISGIHITVKAWVDALGTWSSSRIYGLTDSFELDPLNDYQINTNEHGPLITKIQLPVEMWENGAFTPAYLDAGTAVYPTATDGETYMLFRLDDGREGQINFTVNDYVYTIVGPGTSINEYDCFQDLPYAG